MLTKTNVLDESAYTVPAVIFNKLRGIYFGYIREKDYIASLEGSLNTIPVKNLRQVFYYKCKAGSEGSTGLAKSGPANGSKIAAASPGITPILELARLSVCTKEAEAAFNKAGW